MKLNEIQKTLIKENIIIALKEIITNPKTMNYTKIKLTKKIVINPIEIDNIKKSFIISLIYLAVAGALAYTILNSEVDDFFKFLLLLIDFTFSLIPIKQINKENIKLFKNTLYLFKTILTKEEAELLLQELSHQETNQSFLMINKLNTRKSKRLLRNKGKDK